MYPGEISQEGNYSQKKIIFDLGTKHFYSRFQHQRENKGP